MGARKLLITGVLLLLAFGTVFVISGGRKNTSADSSAVPGVTFGGVSLKILYATTTAAQELGLGNRDFLPPDEAMLFVFPSDGYYGFWMKDTRIPLDIYWLNAQGQVVFLEKDIATSTYPHVFYPTVPARFVLETNAGFARTHGIKEGSPLKLQNTPFISK